MAEIKGFGLQDVTIAVRDTWTGEWVEEETYLGEPAGRVDTSNVVRVPDYTRPGARYELSVDMHVDEDVYVELFERMVSRPMMDGILAEVDKQIREHGDIVAVTMNTEIAELVPDLADELLKRGVGLITVFMVDKPDRFYVHRRRSTEVT